MGSFYWESHNQWVWAFHPVKSQERNLLNKGLEGCTYCLDQLLRGRFLIRHANEMVYLAAILVG